MCFYEQSAFVENRSILDNVLVAIEMHHHLKCKTNGKVGELALKIDISKAYDRVERGYLQSILLKLGNHPSHTSFLLTIVSFFVGKMVERAVTSRLFSTPMRKLRRRL